MAGGPTDGCTWWCWRVLLAFHPSPERSVLSKISDLLHHLRQQQRCGAEQSWPVTSRLHFLTDDSMNTDASSFTHQQVAVQLSSHPPTTSHSSPLHLAPPFPDRRVQASIKPSQRLSVQQQQEVVFDYSFSPNRRSGSLIRSDLLSAAHPGLKAAACPLLSFCCGTEKTPASVQMFVCAYLPLFRLSVA